MRDTFCRTVIGGIVIFGLVTAGDAWAITYSFTKIADNTTAGPVGMLNANGVGKASVSGTTVTFQACYGNGAGCGIFAGSGGGLTTIVKDGDPAPTGNFSSDFTLPFPFGPEPFAGRPTISGSTAAFYAGYDFNSVSGTFNRVGVFSGSGGAVTAIAKTGDAAPSGTFESFSDPAISGSTVAFRGGYTGSLQAVFSSTGGPLTTIAQSGDMVPAVGALTAFSAPAVSGTTVAFEGDYSGGKGIFLGSGGALTVVAKSGDAAPIGTFDPAGFYEPTISGSTAAFRANYGTSAGVGIFKGSGGALTTIAKTGDPAPAGTFTFLSNPSIGGESVAFVGNYGSSHGLFVGDGGALTTVLKKGDVLFGSSVSSITFEKFGMDPDDGSGNLAFAYTLLNGRTGVALAVRGGPPLGDYNRNGTVDTADYVIWRDTMGQVITEGEGADGNFNGVIDIGDYFLWRSKFGQQAEAGTGSASAVTVPEPSLCALANIAVASAVFLRWPPRCRRPL